MLYEKRKEHKSMADDKKTKENKRIAKRKKRKKIIILQLLLVIVVVGGLSILVGGLSIALRHTLIQKKEIEDCYNQLLNIEYSQLRENFNYIRGKYNQLEELYDELQNLPDVTVSAEVDGKYVKLPLYSTMEAAQENVQQLEYERFFIDCVNITVSCHNRKKISSIRVTKDGYTEILYDVRNDMDKDIYPIDNYGFALSVQSYEGDNVLISVLYEDKKMYTVYCPVEKEKSE